MEGEWFRCYACSNRACFSCKSKQHPKVYFCHIHTSNHQTHDSKIIFDRIPVDKRSKESLLTKLSKLSAQCTKDQSKIQEFCAELIRSLTRETQKAIQQLITIQIILEELQMKIIRINEIETNLYYSSLESALLFDNQLQLNKIQPPVVRLQDSSPYITLENSNLSSIFAIYTSFNVYFTSDSCIRLNSEDYPLSPIKKDSSSSIFPVSDHEILITGGKPSLKTAYVIDIHTKNIKKLMNLNKGREFHSTGWIGNHLAILGGILKDDTVTDCVEILKGDVWIEIEPMIHERACFTVSNSLDCLYVFGGYDGEIMDSIEKYDCQLEEWVELEYKLSFKCTSPAVAFDLKGFIIVGGGIGNMQASRRAYRVNYEGKLVMELNNIQIDGHSAQNIWFAEGKNLCTIIKNSDQDMAKVNLMSL